IIGLDAMRSILKTLLACTLLALAAAGQQLFATTALQDGPAVPHWAKAQPAGEFPIKPRITFHPQAQLLAQAGAKRAASGAKSGAPQSQAAQQPTPAPAAPVVTQPMAEEAQHVARYDVAIQPARDHALSGTDPSTLREAMA